MIRTNTGEPIPARSILKYAIARISEESLKDKFEELHPVFYERHFAKDDVELGLDDEEDEENKENEDLCILKLFKEVSKQSRPYLEKVQEKLTRKNTYLNSVSVVISFALISWSAFSWNHDNKGALAIGFGSFIIKDLIKDGVKLFEDLFLKPQINLLPSHLNTLESWEELLDKFDDYENEYKEAITNINKNETEHYKGIIKEFKECVEEMEKQIPKFERLLIKLKIYKEIK